MKRILFTISILFAISISAMAQNFTDPPSPLQPGQGVWLRATNANFRLGMTPGESGVDQYLAVLDRLFTQDRLEILDVTRDGVRTQIPAVPDGSYSIYLDRLGRYASGYAYQPVIIAAATPQGVICSLSDWQTGDPVTRFVALQRVRFSCNIDLRQGYSSTDSITERFSFVFNNGARRDGAFQINFTDGGFSTPVGVEGATEVAIIKRGWWTAKVTLSGPAVEAAPRITKKITLSRIEVNTSFVSSSDDGVIQLPRISFLISIAGFGFGQGGQYTVTLQHEDGGVPIIVENGRAVPQSNGVANSDLLQFEVLQRLLRPGRYFVFATNNLNPTIRTNTEEYTFLAAGEL
jgi:hypothetical protein